MTKDSFITRNRSVTSARLDSVSLVDETSVINAEIVDDNLQPSVTTVRGMVSDIIKHDGGKWKKRTAWRVPVAPIPDTLKEKFEKRAELSKSAYPTYREDPNRKQAPVNKGVLFSVVTIPFLLAAVAAIVLIVTGGTNPWLWAGMFACLAIPAADTVIDHVWKRSGPLALTRSEQKTLELSTREVTFAAKHSDNSPWALPYAAAQIIENITDSPAWQSEYCDVDRIRLNLGEELSQVIRSCDRLTELRNVIDSSKPTGDSEVSRALKVKSDNYNKLYAEAYASIERRVAALLAYRLELNSVEKLLEDIAAITRMDEVDSVVPGILTDMALSKLAEKHIDSVTSDLSMLRTNLETQLDYIRTSVIENPSLDEPLRLAS